MRRAKTEPSHDRVVEGALPAEQLKESFPSIDLPIQPPFPPTEAKPVSSIPSGSGWLYEPKWDGFRCLAFRSGHDVLLQSKAGQPLGRYFPELLEALRALPSSRFVLDGEIVIAINGRLSFDDLLMRIHPAESRIRKLARDTPCAYLVFDLVVDDRGQSLLDVPLSQRRERLQEFFEKQIPRRLKSARDDKSKQLGGAPEGAPLRNTEGRLRKDSPEEVTTVRQTMIRLSPASLDRAQAERWMRDLAASGLDGVVAKKLNAPYASGERTAMQKVKRLRTADCVVGGFRWAAKGGEVGSMLLGLYQDGVLHHVGFTSSFKTEQRKELKSILKPLMGGTGFTGRAPGGPSRWSTERSGQWERLDPKLVCEVQYDHFSGGRFRHGTKFLRWRPDKAPEQCSFEQPESRGAAGLEELGLAG